MGSTTMWVCDGPKCREVTDRSPRERFPAIWPRLVIHTPGDKPRTASFHDAQCAHAWLDEQLGLGD